MRLITVSFFCYPLAFSKFTHNMIDIYNENSSGMISYVSSYDFIDYELTWFLDL